MLLKPRFEVLSLEYGKRGTPAQDRYESGARSARLKRNLTQEQLGSLVGVQKAQISKLEKSANNVTVNTILKVFKALKGKVNFRIAG